MPDEDFNSELLRYFLDEVNENVSSVKLTLIVDGRLIRGVVSLPPDSPADDGFIIDDVEMYDNGNWLALGGNVAAVRLSSVSFWAS